MSVGFLRCRFTTDGATVFRSSFDHWSSASKSYCDLLRYCTSSMRFVIFINL